MCLFSYQFHTPLPSLSTPPPPPPPPPTLLSLSSVYSPLYHLLRKTGIENWQRHNKEMRGTKKNKWKIVQMQETNKQQPYTFMRFKDHKDLKKLWRALHRQKIRLTSEVQRKVKALEMIIDIFWFDESKGRSWAQVSLSGLVWKHSQNGELKVIYKYFLPCNLDFKMHLCKSHFPFIKKAGIYPHTRCTRIPAEDTADKCDHQKSTVKMVSIWNHAELSIQNWQCSHNDFDWSQ